MTDETTTETEDEELARLLECGQEEIRTIRSGPWVDLGELETVGEAREAFRRVSDGSDAQLAILSRWAELAKNRDELKQVYRAADGVGIRGICAHVQTKIVLLCKTRDDLWWARQNITPHSDAWPALVNQAAIILRKEKEK